MSADDTAARSSGRPALAAALLAIVTGTAFPTAGLTRPGAVHPARLAPAALPAGSLPAAACAVPDRVERLLRGPARAHSAACTTALTLTLALLAAAPLALTVLTT